MGDPAANNWPAQEALPPAVGLSIAIKPIGGALSAGGRPRWSPGIKYVPEGCGTGTTLPLYELTEKTPVSRPGEVTWIPYILSSFEECSTFGDDIEESKARARQALLADTERQLAQEFLLGTISQSENWQGAATPNTWLTDDTDPNYITLSGTALPVDQAFQCLDAYLLRTGTGEPGAIHVPIEVFDAWVGGTLLSEKPDGKHYTPAGNLVITSPGYTGEAPDGTAYAAGGMWVYATDMPRVFLSDIHIPPNAVQVVDRRTNDVAVLAERLALAEWKRCRHAGVQVDIDVCNAA